jgi:hypothetical protein
MIEIRITNPKLASRVLVNTAVCVRKPGPMAEVAIKKAAAMTGELLSQDFFFILSRLW